MKLHRYVLALLALAGLEGLAWWQAHAGRAGAAGLDFVDRPLLEITDIERAARIVIREKPQTKIVHKEEGFEVRRIAEDNEPVRETVLVRRDKENWTVASYFDLEADLNWMGQTMRDLNQGRLRRYVTGDPELMGDLELDIAQVRLEDERGRILRQLDFGRKDGGDTYQFVRVDGRDVYVAKHEAELLGDPLAWIVTRVFQFEPGDVRQVELPFRDPQEPPLLWRRPERGQPLRPIGEQLPRPDIAAQVAEEALSKLLAEPILLALRSNAPEADIARQHIVARVRLELFDGRSYTINYGRVPGLGTSVLIGDFSAEAAAFAFIECSDRNDLTQRYEARATLVYSRGATLGRLPKDRAALSVPSRAVEEGPGGEPPAAAPRPSS